MANVKLKLGDIIQISAPTDTDLDGHVFYIRYIDEDKIRLEEANRETILTLTDGYYDNESIEGIRIKNRAEEDGYARQNNLLPGVWIDLHFSGDLPLTLTGKITNLEKDRIEITTFPENDVLFIDFAYRGLPEDLPIEKIQIRKAPAQRVQGEVQGQVEGQVQGQIEGQVQGQVEGQVEGKEPSSTEELERRYKEIQQQLLEIPEEEIVDENLEFEKQKQIQEQTRSYLFNADQIQFGEDLEAITQRVDVPEEEQRYDIDKQLDDLLDDMLSTIPNAQRTDTVKNDIHKMIQRFKQLRDKFSIFDEKGHALMPKSHGTNYKPLVGIMERLEKQLYWMLPVVKTIKKIYTSEEGEVDEEEGTGADDVQTIVFETDVQGEKKIVDNYQQNVTENESNKYAVLQKELNPYLTPFLEPTEKEDVIDQLQVKTTITAVVDNLDNFNSSVDGNDTYTSPHSANKYEWKRKIQKKRFATQTYTLGATGLEITKVRGDNPIIKRKELTKHERLDLKAILTLPEPTVRFSRINLQTATILEKSNLNLHFLNYWQLLKESAHVKKTTITDLEKPYEHHAESFLKDIQNFQVRREGLGPAALGPYSKFLETIIPKTKFLFNLIKPYLVGKLSINDILTYLEPFMIYHEDLSITQYKEMTDYIDEKIIDYRKKYATKARDYAALKGSQNVILPSLLKVLDENSNLRTKVLDVYGFTDTIMTMSNADFIKRIYEIDGGVFYNNAIALISTNLMIADGTRDMADIDMYLNKEKNEPQTKTKGKTAKAQAQQAQGQAQQAQAQSSEQECAKIKVIAKRYIELDELTEDNGKEIYFDKKYDLTSYDIGEIFKADALLPRQEQIQHYMGKLMKNKGLDELSARRDAEAILKGKRAVVDGEYALLETTNETSATLQYYVRRQETWVLDESIDAETFADNMKMFCNLNEKCIAVKDKCEDQTTGANQLKKHNLKLLLAEFNTTLNVNKDIINNTIEEALTRADTRIDILRNLRLTQLYTYDTKKVEIGNTAEETQKIIVSPYDGLLNTITLIRQTDIAKYYLKISDFVKAFTREGLEENGESQYWLYCIKSNKKMLPSFIYKLATTFLTGGNFGQMLDKICASQGTISEDGDKYVDKYSGYTIKMIELSADEEYNEEGFKIITNAVLENDIGDEILQSIKNAPLGAPLEKRKYATPDATAIYNVIAALSTNMGLTLEYQKEFIVRNVLKQLSNPLVITSKAAYDKSFALMASKGKAIDTYEKAFNATLLYLTFSYYLIAIQTSVPPVKTKNTFPGCKKSFSGFPVEAAEDMTGLTYIACVAFKLKNPATLPWSAIANRSAAFIGKQMEGTITKFILQTEEVQNEIKTRTLHLGANPETTIPEDHAVENWSNFLPPLKAIKMATTQDVGEVFKSRLSDSLRKGQKTQEDYISELQSKMYMFSFNIIDLIEKTVHGEQAILKGKNGEPYVENACCEIGENNTMRYFIKKQPEIVTLNNKVVRLSDMYDDIKRLGKAVVLYDPSNTKRKLREIENKFSEQTIYRAFIVYCKFNSLLPLSDNLKAICPTKPDHFDMNDTLEESIRKLKSNARNYSEHSLQQLLNIINTSTKTSIKSEEKETSNANKLGNIMAEMDEANKRPSVFRTAFMNILETFEMNALSEDTDQMRKFKNILARLNEDMQKQIIEFIGNFNTNVKNVDLRDFKKCLETLMDFKETGNNMILQKKEETGYKMVQFMKKAMRSLTREFPNIIINKVEYDMAVPPKHWELSAKHIFDVHAIIKNHYSDLALFYKDAQIRLVLEKMRDMTSDVNDLAQNTLFYAPVEIKGKQNASEAARASAHEADGAAKASDGAKYMTFKYSAFDLDLTTLLFQFYFFSALMDLIAFQTDQEILGLPLKQLEESSTTEEDEESFMAKANERDILVGNQAGLAEKIASLIVSFTNLICKDKSAINYNYKSLMDFVLRSKVKEKEVITDYLKNMTVEEREIENLLKGNKLEEWSVGQQKGFHTYQKQTYDAEREAEEKQKLKDLQLNKQGGVTEGNRFILGLDAEAGEAADAEQDREDNIITYMGEDAEPEDYDMDGDETY